MVGFSQLLNRVAGAGDEMSAYFKAVLLPERPIQDGPPLDVPIQLTQNLIVPSFHSSTVSAMSPSQLPSGSTPAEILGFTLYGDLGKTGGEA